MRINSLNLTNFRGLRQLELSFERDITVIAGVNGSGKSAILSAIASVASHVIPEITPSQEQTISFSDKDVYSGQSSLTVSVKFDVDGQRFHAEMLRTKRDQKKIEELKKRRDDIRFKIRQTKKKSPEETDLKNEIKYLDELLSGENEHFSFQIEGAKEEIIGADGHPLVVLYNTSRYLTRLPQILPKLKPFEPATAYSKALDGLDVNLNDFASWFRAVESGSLGKYRNGKAFYKQLQKALDTLLPGFTNLELHSGPPPSLVMEKDGVSLSLEKFSDGERGLLALAFDLSRRLAIANPDTDNPIAEGRALVLIDEIELHLHPRWQREVIRRLTTTFKNCQFVVTTHSPQVVGEIEGKNVRLIESDETGKIIYWTPDRAFGMDTNRILEELMDAPAQNKELKKKILSASQFVEEERFDKAREVIRTIEKRVGSEDSDIVRLRSLISFLEGEE